MGTADGGKPSVCSVYRWVNDAMDRLSGMLHAPMVQPTDSGGGKWIRARRSLPLDTSRELRLWGYIALYWLDAGDLFSRLIFLQLYGPKTLASNALRAHKIT